MRFPLRAAALAVVTAVSAFGAFYAGPSRAWELSTAPLTLSYLDHGEASAESGDLSLNGAEASGADGIGAPPPVSHSENVLPEPEPEPEPAPARRGLAELVAEHGRSATDDAEHECIAVAVYFESKGESLQGQLSVAEVVLNRARSPRFPSTACGVVRQRGQFSFVRRGRFPPVARSSPAWRKAVAIAHIAREDLADSPATKALFFHARYVRPGWRGLKRVATVGNHIFYR